VKFEKGESELSKTKNRGWVSGGLVVNCECMGGLKRRGVGPERKAMTPPEGRVSYGVRSFSTGGKALKLAKKRQQRGTFRRQGQVRTKDCHQFRWGVKEENSS